MKPLCITLAVVAAFLFVWMTPTHAFQTGPFPDFDEDGVVGFADFLQFAGRFGAERGDETYQDRFDLDGDGSIGFPDFVIFAGNFGKASLYGGDENDVQIPDANLRAVIADSVGKSGDEAITRAEMETLTELKAPDAKIRDLTGIQFASNLTELWLENNAITDLGALCDLTKLTDLVLYSNAISDISALANLTNLHHLNLSHNTLSNISVLANLTNLGYLGLSDNTISDISALTNLTDLIELRLYENTISDISALANLTDLRTLELNDNRVSDFSALSDLTNLTDLRFANNNVSNLSVLANLTKLTLLDISDNGIQDIAPLAALTNLTWLSVGGPGVTDVSVLSNLTDLEWLDVSGTGISDISALDNLTNLVELNLNDNTISDISAISRLTKLNVLNLSQNSFPDCNSDLSALTNLIRLTRLNLSDNRISDLSQLVPNRGFDSGDVVDVRVNPLSVESVYAYVPALQDRGVAVQFDNRQPVSECLPILPQEHSVDAGSSHSLQSNDLYIDREGIRPKGQRGYASAVVYADINSDGHVDIFYAPSEGWQRDPIPAELYLNNDAGCFTLDTSILGANPPRRLAPRKALPGDFNGDGRMDVFVLDHGYDKPPFPGAAPYVILSSGNGYVLGSGLESLIGFQHGGASADIDSDGDIDVFVTDLRSIDAPFFLINDGSGSFALDTDRVEGLERKALYTAELVDVDGDGFLDLLAAGHEYDSGGGHFPTQILWGDHTGKFSTNRATILPGVSGRGIVVDIDVSDTDGDGDKDIVIDRTSDDSTDEWYSGYYVQLVEQVGGRRFEDKTVELLHQNADEDTDWIVWIRMCDCDADGDVDIVVDDAARNLIWKNDGTGQFHRR